MIVLDVDVTPELEQEGRARDLIRLVQQARRDADLAVTDRIAADDQRRRRSGSTPRGAHEALIAGETLATSIVTDDAGTDTPEITVRPAAGSIRRSRSRRGYGLVARRRR